MPHVHDRPTRRRVLQDAAAASAALTLAAAAPMTFAETPNEKLADPLFRISLAEWSLHRELGRGGKQVIDNLDFPAVSRSLGIDAVEYVNQFFKDKAGDKKYLAELKKRCDGEGVRSLLIMCDGEGRLGDPDDARRKQAVENHHRWVEAAKFLGCHSIRVNAASAGSFEEQLKLAADGLAQLTDFSAKHEINTIVENHGGLSSDGQWLAGVMKTVNHPRCGTLPDFGNFGKYDRYQGVAELMPFARGVSAKSHDFDDDGNEKHTDFRKMMTIVLDNAPKEWIALGKYVGVEFEGRSIPERKGIELTRDLLITIRNEMSA